MPKSRSRRKHRSRPGPGGAGGGSRPPSLAEEQLFRMALTSAREVAAEGDPLSLEMWGSDFLGAAWQGAEPGDDGPAIALVELLVGKASRARSFEALALIRTLEVVGPPETARRAASAASVLRSSGVLEPGWLGELGRAAFDGAWLVTHAFGDQDVVLIGFRYPSGDEHMMSVLVDRNVGGIAKEIGVTDRPEEVLSAWRAHPEFKLEPIDAAEAAGRVRDALATTDLYLDPPIAEDYPEHVAFARARVRGLPDTWEPEPEREWTEAEREALVEEFLGSPEARRSRQPVEVVRSAAEAAVAFACDYGPGDPLRWNPVAVELFLVFWCPRKLTVDAEILHGLPAVLRAFIRYGGRRIGLADDLVRMTVRSVDRFRGEFLEAARDPPRFGPAKAIATAMVGEGVDITDPEAVQRWIDAFNARPFEERERLIPGP